MTTIFRLLLASKLIFSKPRTLLFSGCVGLIFVLGCGASTQFDLGIPASKSESFFFHMKQAASEFGYDGTINVEGQTFRIGTPSGTLLYQTNAQGDGLEVVLSSKVHQNNSDMEKRWLENLEKIHDKVLARARVLSKSNQDWN